MEPVLIHWTATGMKHAASFRGPLCCPGSAITDKTTFTFDFEGSQLRAVLLNEAAWFIAADVCRALGLANATMALKPLAADEKGLKNVETLGGRQTANCISEPGLYKLLQASRKPQAKAFDRWFRHDVLPAIRKDGAYVMGEEKVVAAGRNSDLDANC